MEGYKGFAYIYDNLTDDVEYTKRADYLELLFDKFLNKKPKLVCDLGCGTGTMCNILAQRGYDMIGIDNSYDMLDVAINKSENKNILYLNQDMTNFELYGTVDVILSMLDSVNYLTEEGDFDVLLKLVKNYLNPGGLFIFDVNTPYKYEHVLADNVYTYEKDNIFYTWENNFDGEFCDFYLNFFVKDKNDKYSRITEIHTQKLYNFNYIIDEINNNNLKLMSIYADLSLKSTEKDTERAFFIVKKC